MDKTDKIIIIRMVQLLIMVHLILAVVGRLS